MHVQEGRYRQAMDAGGRHPHGEFGGFAAIRLGDAVASERFKAHDVRAGCHVKKLRATCEARGVVHVEASVDVDCCGQMEAQG